MVKQAITTVMDLLAERRIDRETARLLVQALQQEDDRAPAQAAPLDQGFEPVAVIGVAAELPGAESYDDFWRLLMDSADQVGPLPPRRRELCAPVLPAADAQPEFLTGAWLDDIDRFDAEFFSITPAEARTMDPQHRRFIQVAYHCLEDAGWAGRIRGTRTGVYVSAAGGDYCTADPDPSPASVPGRVPSFAASRLSYLYDLRGPSYVTSSTCASSLVALNDACAGLRAGDCEMALVGGVTIFSFPLAGEGSLMDAAGIMSSAGRCRPFDDGADGIARGEGAVALLLKPLGQAVAAGDRIRAVIRSVAINNDGAGAALTAPNSNAHSELLDTAWRRAGVTAESISYIEAHGTGTRLGDPIEIRGINDAVRRHTSRRQFIALGSVKGNIGHLVDGVAGLSSLVKTMLVLEHGVVPPTANLNEPNRHIDFMDAAVFVPTTPWDLRAGGGERKPLLAGTSCFGFNGTNVHVVLEEAPAPAARPAPTEDREFAFPLSAASEPALQALLAQHARPAPRGVPLRAADVAFTLWAGRDHLTHRVALVASGVGEFRRLCQVLSDLPSARWSEIPGVAHAAGSAPPDHDGDPGAAHVCAREFAAGNSPEWEALFRGAEAIPVSLTTYPFDRSSHWIGTSAAGPVEHGDEPADPLGRVLAAAHRVLGYPDLTARDSFISRGGTSLSAMQMQAEILRAYGWDLGMDEILAARDFGALAAAVQERQGVQAPATSSNSASVPSRKETSWLV